MVELSLPLSATATLSSVLVVVLSDSLPLFEKLPLPESDTATFVELSELSELLELSELSEWSELSLYESLVELSLPLSATASSVFVVSDSLPLFEKLPLPESATSTFVELSELFELSLLESLVELSLPLSATPSATLVVSVSLPLLEKFPLPESATSTVTSLSWLLESAVLLSPAWM